MSLGCCMDASLSPLSATLWDSGYRLTFGTVGIGQDEVDLEEVGRCIQSFIGCKVQIKFLFDKFRKLFHLVRRR